MTPWPSVALGDVADVLVGYAYKSSEFTSNPDDTRLLRGANIGQGFLDWGRTAFWPSAGVAGSRYQLAEGDVVLAMDRPWIEAGLKRARIRADDLPALLVQRVARLRGTRAVRTSFLHHLLATETFSRYLQSIVTGATVPHVSQSQIEGFRFGLPPIPVQDLICEVLDSIDELMENTQRRVEVLEEAVRTIYREWFSRFRYPGHGDVPLVDSPIGHIPEGWAAQKIGDVLELRYGKALRKEDRRGGPVAVVSSAGVVGWHDEPLVHGPTIVVGRKGNVGSVTWVDGDTWPIDTAYYVESELPLRYVVEQLRGTEFLNTHAAVPGLSRDQAYSRPFLRPPMTLMEEFDAVSGTLAAEMKAITEASRRLGDLRDLVLPKLVTGEIEMAHLDLGGLIEAAVA